MCIQFATVTRNRLKGEILPLVVYFRNTNALFTAVCNAKHTQRDSRLTDWSLELQCSQELTAVVLSHASKLFRIFFALLGSVELLRGCFAFLDLAELLRARFAFLNLGRPRIDVMQRLYLARQVHSVRVVI